MGLQIHPPEMMAIVKDAVVETVVWRNENRIFQRNAVSLLWELFFTGDKYYDLFPAILLKRSAVRKNEKNVCVLFSRHGQYVMGPPGP